MLTSPTDDFEKLTLSAINGTLAKLDYIANLRRGDGSYYHWGFVRAYGEQEASSAISRVHGAIFSRILRTPVPELFEELKATTEILTPEELIEALKSRSNALVPVNRHGGSLKHFNLVLETLSALVSSPTGRNVRVS